MRIPFIALAAVMISTSSYATSPQCEKEMTDESKALDAKRITLPAMATICTSLGLQANCDESDLMSAGAKQTDPGKWYDGTAGYPDSEGKPPASQCRDPVAIKTYGIYDGSSGTTYACLEPLADDHITPDEIKRIEVLAKRLNSIQPKTLEDHERVVQFKSLVHYLGG